jgi:uracil-DNA glycosylase family protein
VPRRVDAAVGIESPRQRKGRPAPAPVGAHLPVLRRLAGECRSCPLWERATQTVFGTGPAHAPFLLVGEQPGDQEDREGAPFVGPAGRLLGKALEAAGLGRGEVYLTNAVKHFKWKATANGGKRRIHDKPSRNEVLACRPWLLAEIEAVAPEIIVCLGATAAGALLGPQFRVTQHRGEVVPSPFRAAVLATVHPASILRARDEASRARELDGFIRDLRAARKLVPRH